MLNFLRRLLGLNPDLPFYWDVKYPMHGQSAKNHKHQEVIWDEKQTNSVTGQPGKWVMPQNFSDRDEVTIS